MITIFVFMFGIAQHVGLTLTNLSSLLSIYANLLLANNFVGILTTSGFSFLSSITLSASFPHLSFHYFSK